MNSLNNVEKNEIIWRCYFSNILKEEEKKLFLEHFNYMPTKGCGGIAVAKGQKEQAIAILKDYVGEYEFDYYPKHYDFITEENVSDGCYGKFDIENPIELIKLFIEKNVTIINANFRYYEDF
jgi:hypothetical protein